ncbi:MAG: hypothetical protein HQL76_07720 [Magnetococcales bacterium]|nr:hypothetical protein [Magnetococcales bacterium]
MFDTEGEQLFLLFNFIPDDHFGNFLVEGKNKVALDSVIQFIDDTDNPGAMVVVGETGTGKTHLLRAAIRRWNDRSENGICFHCSELIEKMAVRQEKEIDFGRLNQLLNHRMISLDGLEELDQNELGQEMILYFFNLFLDHGGKLLFASRIHPVSMKRLRPELRSRLLWGNIVELSPINDQFLGRIMKKIGLDRSIDLSDDLVNYLVLRLPRSVAAYAKAIEVLDWQSSKMSRNISIPLAKELFQL